ncbi:MAG: lysophospholipid acyltransferase family protein [Promethearchaeota archaeon]
MEESSQEKGEKRERKKNPAWEFVKKAIIKPLDQASYSLLKLVQEVGLERQIQYPFYLSQDQMWYRILKSITDFEIMGDENIPPEGEGAILCVNHQSLFDPVLFCMCAAHHQKRRLHCMGKIEAFDFPLVGVYVRWCYAFPIVRGGHDMEAYKKAVDLLKRGELLGIYPEGTTNNGGYNFLEPKTGAIRMAIDGEVPIIPVGISGSDRFFGRRMRVPNPNTKIIVNVGRPIMSHAKYFGKPMPSKDKLQEHIDEVMAEIRNLLFYEK